MILTRNPVRRAVLDDADSAAKRPAPSVGSAGVVANSRFVLVLGVACAATFLGFLDITAVAVLVGPIGDDLAAAPYTVTWVVAGYAIAYAAWLATAGRLADTIGHRRILLVGVGGFAAASGVCAAAPSVGVLIGARVVQGVSGALLLPAALGVLLAATDPSRRSRVIGAWSASGAFATAVGPVVGALTSDVWSWRGLFILNLLVCAGLAVATYALPATAGARSGLPDVAGAAALTVGVAAIMATASQGRWWDAAVAWGCAAGGVALVGAVVLRSWRHPRPALEVRLWRHRQFAAGSVCSFTVGAGMFTFLLHAPLLLNRVWAMALLPSAVSVGAIGVVGALASVAVGRFTGRTNAHVVCAVAMVSLAAGYAVLASPLIGTSRSWAVWLLVVVLVGVGLRMAITALSVTVANAAATRAGSEGYASAVALNVASRQVGGAVGVCLLAAVSAGSGFVSEFHQIFTLTAVTAILGAFVATRMGPDRCVHVPPKVCRVAS